MPSLMPGSNDEEDEQDVIRAPSTGHDRDSQQE
jgi:hypothetical protein